MGSQRIPFDFDPRYRAAGRLFGVTPATSYVQLEDERLTVRFGRWVVDTPRSNIRSAQVSGPYSVVKTIGPAHLSAADRGLTFASNNRSGACLTFREPVTGIDPLGIIKHPGLTVTVSNPEALVAELTADADRTDLAALLPNRSPEPPASPSRR